MANDFATNTAASAETTVSVKFFSRQPRERHVLPAVSIVVPTRLRRYGLSEVINHLLGTGDTPTPFDFLIDKRLLRTSLQEYLDAQHLSTENTLSIEVIESLVPPRTLAAYEHDDWVCAVDDGAVAGSTYFATGCYDNAARLWDASGTCMMTMGGHGGAVKAVKMFSAASQPQSPSASILHCITASQDQTARVWQCDVEKGLSTAIMEMRGHEGSVDGVDVRGMQLLTASWDTSIRLWSLAPPADDEESVSVDVMTTGANANVPAQKKRRAMPASTSLVVRKPLATMNGHAGPVSCVVFDRQMTGASDAAIVAPTTFYSGSWDHTVRVWDLEAHVFVKSISCDHVVTSIDHSSQNGLLATGHSDRVVRLWDPRSSDGAMVKLKLAGHTGWVSSVSWSPSSAYTLVSGSYDGTLKIWDVRSTSPLYTIAAATMPAAVGSDKSVPAKVLCTKWCAGQDMLVGGGEDGKLSIHSYAAATAAPVGMERVAK